MASNSLRVSAAFFLTLSMGTLLHSVFADDAEDQLLNLINGYRKNNSLPFLLKNDNAECLAEQILNQFKGQPCTNTTGEDTVPGTEPQFQNYPQLLQNCHLNISDTRNGAVLPDCVTSANPNVAFINYTYPTSQYVQYVNSSIYVSAGVASEGNWFVVVLATNTSGGSFQTATDTGGQVKLSSFSLVFSSLVIIFGALVLSV